MSQTEATQASGPKGPKFGTEEWNVWMARQLDAGRKVLAANPLPKVAVRWEAKAA